jgi:hypothetical protein
MSAATNPGLPRTAYDSGGMGKRARIVLLVLIASCAPAAVASADSPVGKDPSSNFSPGLLPPQCDTDPTGALCVESAVTYLNAARAHNGAGPYVLPGDFTSLTPAQQALVLTDLDRTQVGLPPVPGLTDQLDQDAAGGVRSDGDPAAGGFPSFTSNWAGGFSNMPFAYEAWMYDDGPGSGNLDCPRAGASGCWGHRHDILWGFGAGGPLAMGAAAGNDSGGMSGFAMLLAQGGASYHPVYTYTWAQAIANGAGGPLGPTTTGSGGSGSTGTPGGSGTQGGTGTQKKVRITRLKVNGHRVSVSIAAPSGQKLRCTLARQAGRRWRAARLSGCARSYTILNVPSGHWRLRVSAKAGSATRYFRVR